MTKLHDIEKLVRCHFGGSSTPTATTTTAKAPTNADAASSYSVQQSALSEQKRRGYQSTVLTSGMGTQTTRAGTKTLLGG